MGYVVIDVETANADQSSICELGWALVSEGAVVGAGATLLNPQCHFDCMNVSIHGIRPEDVRAAPTFNEFWPQFVAAIGESVIASHGAFDRTAIYQATPRWGLPQPPNPWLDVTRVIRRVWPDIFAARGYNLANACSVLGVVLDQHHRAEADAVAAARVLIKALDAVGWTVDEAIPQSMVRMNDKQFYAGQPAVTPEFHPAATGARS